MSTFRTIFKQYIQFYIYLLIILILISFFTHNAFIYGIMIGVVASTVNTYLFESKLRRAQASDTAPISTGSAARFLVTAIACCMWVLFKPHVSIIGILIGLLISYLLIILRPLYNHS